MMQGGDVVLSGTHEPLRRERHVKRLIIACAMCICVVSATVASADTLVLKDGTRIEGTIVGVVERTITFRRADGVSRQVPGQRGACGGISHARRCDLPSIKFRRTRRARRHRACRSNGRGHRLENARTNQTFGALIEQSVENGAGTVIVPEGSHARLIIRHLTSGGTTGSPEMAVDIQSIEVDGRTYAVNTTDLTLEGDTGIGKNKRTAQTTGGGALLGTIIGAIAGGGKGAAIGAVVGAAGGATAQVLTRGTDVTCRRKRS